MRLSVPPELLEYLSETLGPVSGLEACPGGMSQATVWRIRTHFDSFALKKHPYSSDTLSRLKGIHAFQAALGVLPFVPKSVTWKCPFFRLPSPTLLQWDNYLWELTRWTPGKPRSFDQFSTADIDTLVTAFNGLHTISRKYESRMEIPFGIRDRLSKLCHWKDRLEDQASFRYLGDRANRWHMEPFLALARARIPPLIVRLKEMASPRLCQWTCRDVRLEHSLFDDEKFSGFIDFGSAKIDWPIFDLIRFLSTSIDTSRIKVWRHAYESLDSIKQENQVSFDDFRCLAESSLVLSGLYWFEIHVDELSKELRDRLMVITQQLGGFTP